MRRSPEDGRPPVLFDQKWEEAWHRRVRGQTVTLIAEEMGVTRKTVSEWIKRYSDIVIERNADPEAERWFLIGRFEYLAQKSIEAFETALDDSRVQWTTDPRPGHMANALKALSMVMKLTGFDVRRSMNLHQHTTGDSEVKINVGGQTMVSKRVRRLKTEGVTGDAIQVAAREMAGPGDGPGGAPTSEDGEASSDD